MQARTPDTGRNSKRNLRKAYTMNKNASDNNHDSNQSDRENSHQNHDDNHHDHSDHHAHMVADFRRRFWVSFILGIPVVLLSPMI